MKHKQWQSSFYSELENTRAALEEERAQHSNTRAALEEERAQHSKTKAALLEARAS